MVIKMKNNIFLDYNKIYSYNKTVIIIIGGRGIGKSYGAKERVIDNFKKRDEEFIYLRRYKQELKKTAKTFFNDISKNDKYKNDNFKYDGSKFYCNDKIFGYSETLNTSLINKGISYPNVTTIIFDEFLIDSPVYRYLPHEVNLFLDFLESVFRLRNNFKVIMLANSVNFNNPYFRFWNIKNLKKEFNVMKNRDILIVLPKMEEFKEVKKQTTLYSLYEGTSYEKFNVENQFQDMGDKRFIEKLNFHCKYYFTIIINKKKYGIYKDYFQNKIIVSKSVNNTCPINIALTFDDMNPNSILAKNNLIYLNSLKNYFNYGLLFFESEIVYSLCKDLIDYIR